jgi:Cys-rich protein (TIGR01571 family)
MDITKFPKIPCVDKCACFDRPSMALCMYAIGFWGGIVCRSIDQLFFVLGILAVCTHYNIRHSIRDKLDISSNCCCEDLWCSICCYSCAMTQEYKQLNEISSGQPTTPNSMNTPILPRDVQQQQTRP